jgi:hypothetical protein
MKSQVQQQKPQEVAQPKAEKQASISTILSEYNSPVQKKENKTGLPDNLKSGIENLSGHSMDDVKVHYGSSKPAELQAHAYAQGTNIHVASGQEKHLPHEAWHVVQQKQGRVKPTMQMKGKVNVNDDTRLETEADVMGVRALQMKTASMNNIKVISPVSETIQRKDNYDPEKNKVLDRPDETDAIKTAKIASRKSAKKEVKNKLKKEARKANKGKSKKAQKSAAKDAANTMVDDELKFTAHHKYPWHSIKQDIEYAFTAPDKPATLKALQNLESFSKELFPLNKITFLKSVDDRENSYHLKPDEIDNWIQEVCWVPANIFIGPLSDKRLDDPSKRGENEVALAEGEEFDPEKRKITGMDAHYVKRGLERKMSVRSLGLNSLGKGGLSTTKFETEDNTVAPYVPDEWNSHAKGSVMKEGEVLDRRMYTQANDSYIKDSIYPYHVTSTDKIQSNYDKKQYILQITTSTNVEINRVQYDSRNLASKDSKAKFADFDKIGDDSNKKTWRVIFPTPKGYLVNNVKLYLTNSSNKESNGFDLGINISHETEREAKLRKDNKPSSSAFDDLSDGESMFGGMPGYDN